MLFRLERCHHPHSLASESESDPNNSPAVCFAEIGPALLAIDDIESNIQWVAENDLLRFLRFHIVFGDVVNVCVVPVTK
jgi:hypothetical protein